jgi:SnoaL-like domain
MNNFTKWIFIFYIIFGLSATGFAQVENLETVRAEIQQMNDKEQNAFINGSCDELMTLMDESITFIINGRKAPSKGFIKNMCQKMPRPFGKPALSNTKIYVLSKDSGYVVKMMELAKDDGVIYKKEVITKIWRKTIDGWKMAHLHSTVKDVIN